MTIFPRFRGLLAAVACTAGCLCAQVIEFESGGLKYQTLSKSGLTIMYAHLPVQVREYVIVQATVTNGSQSVVTIRPENFVLRLAGGRDVRAGAASAVVSDFLARAGRNDVIRLVSTYEVGLYGLSRFRSTNGYEQRRQSALAEVTSTRLRAAAAASAIVFVEVKLAPGDSTDGALFFPTRGVPLLGSRLRVAAAGQSFEFLPESVEPAR
ncbi:MAG: hypothetical protein IT159_15835 [Bryobacterales bacterium]|nr:hypothetical protein [Bryobacterales bacterium]